MAKLEAYDKALDYSYAPGIFPATECLKNAKKRCMRLLVSSNGLQSEGVQALARKYGAEFLDLNKDLYDAAGNLKAEYTIEGMHLYANGYRPVMDALLPLLRRIGEEQGGKP